MLRVGTDHHNAAFALDDLAFFANRFDGRSYFHLKYLLTDTIPVNYFTLFGTPCNASFGQVIGAHFERDLTSRQDPDEIHPLLA